MDELGFDPSEFVEEVSDTEMLQIGGALDNQGQFIFRLRPFVERRSQRMGVVERHFDVRVEQRGQFSQHQHVVTALNEGLHQAIRDLINQEGIRRDDRVYVNLSSQRLNYAYNYRGLRANEWIHGGARVDALLGQMASVLNSNEDFQMDDSFHLSFTHVRRPPRGSGRKRKLKPGHKDPLNFKV